MCRDPSSPSSLAFMKCNKQYGFEWGSQLVTNASEVPEWHKEHVTTPYAPVLYTADLYFSVGDGTVVLISPRRLSLATAVAAAAETVETASGAVSPPRDDSGNGGDSDTEEIICL